MAKQRKRHKQPKVKVRDHYWLRYLRGTDDLGPVEARLYTELDYAEELLGGQNDYPYNRQRR